MKFSILTLILLAAFVGDMSSNAQDRNRSSSRENARKAWAERIKKYQEDRAKAAQGRSSHNRQPSSRERSESRGQANPLDPEAVKRRLDYGVKEGLLTREQAEKLMAEAKKRIKVASRENNERREQGDNNEGRDRQDQARMGYEARRKRIEEGVRSGKIKREDAAKMLEELRKRMATASRGGDNEGRGRESQSNDRQDQAREGYEVRRKRIEEGVRSGKIKREDAAKMLEELRKRMEAFKRGVGEKKAEGKQDPRLERYRATERELAAAVKAGKLSKEDAQKKLIAVRMQLWGGDKSNKSSDNNRKRTGDIVEVAAGNKSFKTLAAAVKAAGLVDTLKGKGPYTVFAPTDAAFAKLPKGTLQSLLKPENKKKLASILTYHVVPGRVLAKDVKNGRVKTANGSSFEIKLSRDGVTVNNAKVLATDVMASNGVIHVIDTVIIPQSSPQSRSTSRGYLGVSVESSSRPKGLRVQQVYANTAAARGKLKRGDIILKINGSAVTSNSSLIGRLSKTEPGQKATLLVSSGGKTKTVQVQLGRSYSTRSSAQSNSSKSGSSQSKSLSQSRIPQRSSGTDWRKAIEERMKKAREDRERAERNSRDRDNDRGRSDRGEDMRKAWEERIKQAREARERAERNSWDRDNDRGRSDHGEDMRKAWEERIKKHLAERSKASQSRGSSSLQQRSSDTDWRKAIEERMKKVREDRERAERNSWGRENDRGRSDRGEDMRKEWEERIKKYLAERSKAPQSRGSSSSQQRRPSGDRRPQGHGPQRGGDRRPQGHGPQRGGDRRPQGHGPQRGGDRHPQRGGPRGR